MKKLTPKEIKSIETQLKGICFHNRTIMVGGVGTIPDPPNNREVCLDCGEQLTGAITWKNKKNG